MGLCVEINVHHITLIILKKEKDNRILHKTIKKIKFY